MDRAPRPVPFTDVDAVEMLDECQAGELLVDPRRSPPADRAGVRPVIARVRRFAKRLPGVELDINPLIIGPSRGVAADPRIRVAPPPTGGPAPRTLRI
jgi:hypothetical protein